jgi:NADP-dependent 3-hydroxy acid dehydrogenase YdfG
MPLLVVIGYGPGNGHAIAQRFGREGWTIALIGRNEDRLHAGVDQLATEGTTAHAFVSDASDPAALRSTIARIHDELGTITSIALSAFRPVAVGDLLTADIQDVAHVFDISVMGLLAAVQAALHDLRAADGASRFWSSTARSACTTTTSTRTRPPSEGTASHWSARRRPSSLASSPLACAPTTSTSARS